MNVKSLIFLLYLKRVSSYYLAFTAPALSLMLGWLMWVSITGQARQQGTTYKVNAGSQLYYPANCGDTTSIKQCATSVRLNADAGQTNYTWSTGATTSYIDVAASGLYWWETMDLTNNKVVNGNFSNGNTDFSSQYTYKNPNNSTALQPEGTYTVTDNPRNVHPNFSSFTDHSGNGKMMVVNGSVTPGVSIWAQTITVQPNTDYVFSVWFTSVHPSNPGKLNFSINNTVVGAAIELTSGTPDWKNFTVRWNPGNTTTATIGIVNQNTAQTGNDFALDDVVFAPVCRKYFNVKLSPNPAKPGILTL